MEKAVEDITTVASSLRENGFDYLMSAARVWETKTFTIRGATSSTRIRFETTIYETNFRNFSLDDILVFEE
jgi:hypothetical protein